MNVIHFNQYQRGGLNRAGLNEKGDLSSLDGFGLQPLENIESHELEFDVFKEFSRLDVSRKMALFDCIMLHRGFAYRNMMKNIWPHSNENDARALEMMLNARLNRLKQF